MEPELIVLFFDSVAAAEGALSTLQGLEAEGAVAIEECAVLGRDEHGWVTARDADRHRVARTAGFGGVLGLLVGGIVGVPVLGVLAGAGVAAKKTADAGRLEELISTVGSEMTAGTGVLALTVTSLRDPGKVVDRLAIHRDKLLRTEIPASLRDEIERRLDG